jgi:predicted ArsR family transcriptional regulator
MSDAANQRENPDSDSTNPRYDPPTGWLYLTKNDTVPLVIDALLDLPAHREFTQTELADIAGVSRQSVNRHLDLLLAVGVVEPVENTSPQRYRFDADAAVSRRLVELDGAVADALADDESG